MYDDEERVEFTDGKQNGEIIKLLCANCQPNNKHTIIGSSLERIEFGGMWFRTSYFIVRCNGCEQQKFYSNAVSSEDIGYGDDPITGDHEEWLVETINIYPVVNITYEKPKHYMSMPRELKLIYDETYIALCSDAKKLASIGMRSVIEAVCNLHEITDKTVFSLPGKIKELGKQQIISQSMKNVLLGVKEFGDQSAHTLNMPTDEELKAGWDSVMLLASSIYAVQDNEENASRLKGFRKRKGADIASSKDSTL